MSNLYDKSLRQLHTHGVVVAILTQSHFHFPQLTTMGPMKSLSLQHFSNLAVERKNLVSYLESYEVPVLESANKFKSAIMFCL